jgi:hypothetical protein
MSDPLLRVAWAHGGPFYGNDLSITALRSIVRYVALGSVSRVLVCPVIVSARWLGVIELVDPLDGAPFDSAAETAVAYVVRRFEEFLDEPRRHRRCRGNRAVRSLDV